MVQLEILKYIDSFCRENNIRYSLSGGTLLGAVRHGGFIPWDDDLDICMLRSEYNRFVQLWNSCQHDKYLLQSKVQGIVPSTQAKQFYLNNIEKAEDFAYSDISVEELTYNGIVTNHAGKEKASLVNKRKLTWLQG